MTDTDDTPAESAEDIFSEARDRLAISDSAESENRTEGLNALNFREGDQWDSSIKDARTLDKRPALTINHTDTFCGRVENTLRQQRPRIKCHPVGEGATVDTAKVVNGLIRHIETNSNASVAYDLGGTSAIDIGWGYWRIVGEFIDERSFDQELMIRPIANTFTVYDDPASVMPAGEDREWLLISTTMKRSEYRRKYPTAINCEWRSDGIGDHNIDWESKEELRLAEYYRIHEVEDSLCQLSDGSVKYRSELADPNVIAAVGLTITRERKSTRREVQWFRLNGKEVVEERSSAKAKRTGDPADGPIPGRYIPVIRCLGKSKNIDGRIIRSGMIKNLMDPARMFNYTETSKTERYALTPKAPWVAYEESIEGHPEWNDANQKSYSVLVAKAVQGPDGNVLPLPQRTQPAAAEAGMAEWSQSAERNLMAIAGMPQENPEISNRVISGNKYLQRRQGMADLTHWHYYDNQTLAIMWTGIILLGQIPFYYDTPRMQRIIGEDTTPQMIDINQKIQEGQDDQGNPLWKIKNDMTVGRYDVVMDTGPGYATKQEEGAEKMMELLGTPLGEVVVKTGADIVLRNMDFNGSEILADRAMTSNPEAMDKAIENLPDQAKNIIGALKQQLDQAQQTIQQQQLEIKYRSDIEKMKDDGQTRRTLITTTGKAHDTEKSAETDDANSQRDYAGWMHDIDVKRQTALDVAEIRVGGELLNTHVEAAHNAKAADKAIEAGEKAGKTNGGSSAG